MFKKGVSFSIRVMFFCFVFLPNAIFANEVHNFYELGSYPVLVNLYAMPKGGAVAKDGTSTLSTFFRRVDFLKRGTSNSNIYAPFCSTVRIVSLRGGLSVDSVFGINSLTPVMIGRSKGEVFKVHPFFFPGSTKARLLFRSSENDSLVLASFPSKQGGLLLLRPYQLFDNTQMWFLHSNVDESVAILSAAEPLHAVSVRGQNPGMNLFLSLHGTFGMQQAWFLIDSRTGIDCTQYLLNLFAQPYFLDVRFGNTDRWLRLDFHKREPFLNWRHSFELIDNPAPQFVLSHEDRYSHSYSFSKKLRLSNGDCLVPAWNKDYQDVSLYSLSCVDSHASVWGYGVKSMRDVFQTQLCVKHLHKVFCLGALPDPEDPSVHWFPEKVNGKPNPYTILYWGRALPQIVLGGSTIGCSLKGKESCVANHPVLLDEVVRYPVLRHHLVWIPSRPLFYFSSARLCVSANEINKSVLLRSCDIYDTSQDWVLSDGYWRNVLLNGCVKTSRMMLHNPVLMPCLRGNKFVNR
ncbi:MULTISPECIES: hypothetical protein [Candidatus Ichthyocystis]|uniref:Putative membrane protein n=1 Tax=Candidatus Ichthyocystis hellenicum TaxID=1561003 RepID=A0A0S4M3B2_9BURK|nr:MULTISPECIES: hypothetical protein [Ichthyocystis]CUT18174.1 putative membrane protein [Candidatus Ichthyocystis hellenicum]